MNVSVLLNLSKGGCGSTNSVAAAAIGTPEIDNAEVIWYNRRVEIQKRYIIEVRIWSG